MEENKPLVTVYCTAYNQEKYIRSALDGFVMQKTNFPFEVIVHDDASTDKTADIIKEYTQKYPEIIKPIFQTENQYSKGGRIFSRFILPIAQGKYCACCEGDDYWTDENKLQMQVDFLESHPDYSACVHNTDLIDSITKKKCGFIGSETEEISMADLINWEMSTKFHTTSLLCKMDLRRNQPEFVKKCSGIGDYPLSLYLRSQGKIHRFNKTMSVYRTNLEGSWTSKQDKLVEKRKSIMLLINAEYEKRYKDLKSGTLKKWYKQKTAKYKLKIFLLQYFPWVMALKRRILNQED